MKNLTGADVKRWRERAGLTQAELAQHLGVHLRTISAWETGRQKAPAMLGTLLRSMTVLRPKIRKWRAK